MAGTRMKAAPSRTTRAGNHGWTGTPVSTSPPVSGVSESSVSGLCTALQYKFVYGRLIVRVLTPFVTSIVVRLSRMLAGSRSGSFVSQNAPSLSDKSGGSGVTVETGVVAGDVFTSGVPVGVADSVDPGVSEGLTDGVDDGVMVGGDVGVEVTVGVGDAEVDGSGELVGSGVWVAIGSEGVAL